MAHCAVNDFYWEVKINALDFWSRVICRQLSHQGMIDGTFPAVTFSKEHKKIITLNEKVKFFRQIIKFKTLMAILVDLVLNESFNDSTFHLTGDSTKIAKSSQ